MLAAIASIALTGAALSLPIAAQAVTASGPTVTVDVGKCYAIGVHVTGLPADTPAKDAVYKDTKVVDTPAKDAIPATYVQEWLFVQKKTGKQKWMPFDWNGADHPGGNSGSGEDASGGNGEGWSRTTQHKNSDQILTPEVPAVAEVSHIEHQLVTPAVPEVSHIEHQLVTPAVPAKSNAIKVTLDGNVVENKPIGSTFDGSYALPDQNGSHAYNVTVTPWQGEPIVRTGTTPLCAAPPAVEVCNGPSALTWTRNAYLTTATVTLKPGFLSCDVGLSGYATEGPTWPTSGTQAFLDHAAAHLTKEHPTATLTINNDSCLAQNDLFIGTKKFDGIDGALPHYPNSVTPTHLLASWIGYIGGNCAPTVVENASAAESMTAATCEGPGVPTFTNENSTWGDIVKNDDGSFSRTATASAGSAFPGGSTTKTVSWTVPPQLPSQNTNPQGECYVPVAITQQPLTPVFHDYCGVTDDAAVLPADTDTYFYTKKVVEGLTVAHAVARTGYVFDGKIQTTWQYRFTDVPCPVTVVKPPVTAPPVVITPVVAPVVPPVYHAAPAPPAAQAPLQPVSELAHTGSDIPWLLVGLAGLAVILGGGYLLLSGRREHRTE